MNVFSPNMISFLYYSDVFYVYITMNLFLQNIYGVHLLTVVCRLIGNTVALIHDVDLVRIF